MNDIQIPKASVSELELKIIAYQRAHAVLLSVAEGTALTVGTDFFYSLVRNISLTLNMAYAFVTECTDIKRTNVRTLAYWNQTEFAENFEYELEGTPCEHVIRGSIHFNRHSVQKIYYPRDLQQLFPQEEGVESYLGIPLFDVDNQVIGHLVVMDNKEMDDEPLVHAVLKIFATRAAGELHRLKLAIELGLVNEMSRRTLVAESLRDILIVLNSNESLEYVLNYIVEQAKHILKANKGAVYQNLDFEEVSAGGVSLQDSTVVMVKQVISDVLASHSTIVVNDFTTYAHAPMESDVFRAMLAIPLVLKNEIYGCLTLYYTEPRQFTREDLGLATTFSEHFVLAMENAHLRKKAEEMAAMEERNRIARELHDAVSQTLWSANLISDVLPDIWEQNAERGRFKLDQLRLLTRAALIEMRSLLLELRPTALIETSIYELLKRLTEMITARSGLQIMLTIEGECVFPPDVQITLYRITQEGLNNIMRHAVATHVEILLLCKSDRFELTIMDDGQGFDTSALRSGHHGISIMQERANTIGGQLKIVSQQGRGTHVHLFWMNGEKAKTSK